MAKHVAKFSNTHLLNMCRTLWHTKPLRDAQLATLESAIAVLVARGFDRMAVRNYAQFFQVSGSIQRALDYDIVVGVAPPPSKSKKKGATKC